MPADTKKKTGAIPPMHDAASIAEWRAVVEEDERSDNGKDALLFVRFYEDFLKKTPDFSVQHPTEAAVYEGLYSRAQWIAFSFMSQKEGVVVFEKKVSVGLQNAFVDMREKVRLWLIGIPLEFRDEQKQRLLTALRQNADILTKTAIAYDEREGDGAVSAWTAYYLSIVGVDGNNKLAKTQFFFANKAFSRLTKEEQFVVQKLCSLIDMLLVSSRTAEGFEEDRIGVLGTELIDVERGVEKRLSPEMEAALKKLRQVRSTISSENLRSRLMGSEEERSRIRLAEDSLEKSLGADVAKIRDALFVAVSKTSSGSSAEPVALVRLLIKNGGFAGLLREDPRFAELLRKRYEAGSARGKADDLKVYPTSAQHLAAFAQMLLVEQLGLSPSDAARHLIQWMNLLSRAGVKIFVEPPAYFSEEADAFQFAQPLPAVRS